MLVNRESQDEIVRVERPGRSSWARSHKDLHSKILIRKLAIN